MRGLGQNDMAAVADAYMAWWTLAGVDCATGETAVNWLRPTPVKSGSAVTPSPATPVQQPPATLEEFRNWLASDPAQPERRWPGEAILPTGPADAALMVVTDMPDPADMAAGTLLAERAGTLFDAMLRSIGLERANIHLASLFLSRPPGGMVEAADLERAAERMRSHVALAAPRRMLILGDRTVRALMPVNGDATRPEGSDDLRVFNHQGGTVSAVASFHPRLLLTQPAAKAECWRTLQCLVEEKPL